MTSYEYHGFMNRKHEKFINQFHGEVKLNYLYLHILFFLEGEEDQRRCDDSCQEGHTYDHSIHILRDRA